MLSRGHRLASGCLRCRRDLARRAAAFSPNSSIASNTSAPRRHQSSAAVALIDDTYDEPHQVTEADVDNEQESVGQIRRVRLNAGSDRSFKPVPTAGIGVESLGKPSEIIVLSQKDRRIPGSIGGDDAPQQSLAEVLEEAKTPAPWAQVKEHIDGLRPTFGNDQRPLTDSEWRALRYSIRLGFSTAQLHRYIRESGSRVQAHLPKTKVTDFIIGRGVWGYRRVQQHQDEDSAGLEKAYSENLVLRASDRLLWSVTAGDFDAIAAATHTIISKPQSHKSKSSDAVEDKVKITGTRENVAQAKKLISARQCRSEIINLKGFGRVLLAEDKEDALEHLLKSIGAELGVSLRRKGKGTGKATGVLLRSWSSNVGVADRGPPEHVRSLPAASKTLFEPTGPGNSSCFINDVPMLAQLLASLPPYQGPKSSATPNYDGDTSNEPIRLRLVLKPVSLVARAPTVEVYLRGKHPHMGLRQPLTISRVAATLKETSLNIAVTQAPIDVSMVRQLHKDIYVESSFSNTPMLLEQMNEYLAKARNGKDELPNFSSFVTFRIPTELREDLAKTDTDEPAPIEYVLSSADTVRYQLRSIPIQEEVSKSELERVGKKAAKSAARPQVVLECATFKPYRDNRTKPTLLEPLPKASAVSDASLAKDVPSVGEPNPAASSQSTPIDPRHGLPERQELRLISDPHHGRRLLKPDQLRNATMWNGNLLIDERGEVRVLHRKLVPTFFEALSWGAGDGEGLRTVDVAAKRIDGETGDDRVDVKERASQRHRFKVGTLICGENTNPLARYAMMSQGQDVHISTWPAIWPTRMPMEGGGGGGAASTASGHVSRSQSVSPPPKSKNFDNVLANRIRASAHCFEAKCHGIMSAAALSEANIDTLLSILPASDPSRAQFEYALRNSPRAASMFLDPTGTPVPAFTIDEATGKRTEREMLRDEEGVLFADIDPDQGLEAKQFHDLVGGYQRFDVFELRVRRERRAGPVTFEELPREEERKEGEKGGSGEV
ncbi:Nitrilase [Cyphellophora attinorum]|uniref:Nitrilase n=1 Tax=Cyphellophora attinorum TaxID=1664694 RepID=A0A0N1H7V4_9EURO|nr:Nitrilase [Phialophora attinorum]KPI38920.1 Nitrilase [Phialophora attinorum]